MATSHEELHNEGGCSALCITLTGKEERLERGDWDDQQVIHSPVKAVKMGEGVVESSFLEICLSSSAVWGSSGVELPEEKEMNGISSWWASNCASRVSERQHVVFQKAAEASLIL